jgi:hypothetical protein
MTAQAIRAILLASATVASLPGLRSTSLVIHVADADPFAHAWRMVPVAPSTRRILVTPLSRSLPPDEFCRGTRPSQATNSPADRNALWIGDARRDRSRSDETHAWNGVEALAAWT